MPAILVVDDDAVERELARRSLKPIEDLEVRFAENGDQALDAMADVPPDMVLTDLRMPGMTGLELVAAAKRRFPFVPVVVMTSQGNEQTAVQALRAGAASYVSKRDLKRSLVETVEQVLEVAETERSREWIVQHISRSETAFELENELKLVPPLIGYLQESLGRLGFGDDSLRMQVGIAVMEAVNNAIIHGNLEIGSELKQQDLAAYYALIERRKSEAPYASRRVRVTARETAERIEYVVADEGSGFDPAGLPDPTAPENMERVFGRGLLLIRTFMDGVEFSERANEIRMTKSVPVVAES